MDLLTLLKFSSVVNTVSGIMLVVVFLTIAISYRKLNKQNKQLIELAKQRQLSSQLDHKMDAQSVGKMDNSPFATMSKEQLVDYFSNSENSSK